MPHCLHTHTDTDADTDTDTCAHTDTDTHAHTACVYTAHCLERHMALHKITLTLDDNRN